MELSVRKNSKLVSVMFVVVFAVLELGCFILLNKTNIACIWHEKKGNYQNYDIEDLVDSKLQDCVASKDYLEVNGENPSIIIDNLSGYVSFITARIDLNQTYCQYMTIYYDMGNGYQEKNKIRFNISEIPVMKYDINKQIEGLMICFEEVHPNLTGPTTLRLISFAVNPYIIEQCKEQVKDYILCTAIVIIISYALLVFMVKKRKIQISLEKYFLIIILFVLMRLMFGHGYQSMISHTAKILTILLNCITTIFLIFLIVRKNDESEQSED